MRCHADLVRSVVLAISASLLPFVVWTGVYIGWADSPAAAASRAWRIWVGGIFGVGILVGGVAAWKGVWWLAGQAFTDWRLVALRRVALGAVFALPLLWIVLRDDLHYSRILAKSFGLLFWGVVLLIGWVGFRVTREMGSGRARDYLVAFAVVVVTMWLASEGAFRNLGDDEGSNSAVEEDPDPLTERERLLRNIVAYSGAALAGVALAHRRIRKTSG